MSAIGVRLSSKKFQFNSLIYDFSFVDIDKIL